MNQSQWQAETDYCVWMEVMGPPLDLGIGPFSLQVHDYSPGAESFVVETIIIFIINSMCKCKRGFRRMLKNNGGIDFGKVKLKTDELGPCITK